MRPKTVAIIVVVMVLLFAPSLAANLVGAAGTGAKQTICEQPKR